MSDTDGLQPLGASVTAMLKALETHPKADLILAGFESARRGEKPPVGDRPICRRCSDHGWMRPNLMPGDEGFGQLLPCDCTVGRRVLERRRTRIFGEAQVPPKMAGYTLESLAALGEAEAQLAQKLRAWQRSTRWLVLAGPTGQRKSGAAAALLLEHLRGGGTGLYEVLPDFLQRLRQTYDDRLEGESAIIQAAVDVDYLVLDDVGAAKLTEWGQEKVFTLIDRRWSAYPEDDGRHRLIITTNLPIRSADGRGLTIGSYLGAENRAWDRIRERAEVMAFHGPSRREQPVMAELPL